MSTLARVNALWRVPLILLLTAVLASLSVALSLVDGTGRLQHGCARIWSRLVLSISRVRVSVRGLEHLDLRRGYIFTANHLSMFDHWAVLACLPTQFRFVAKAALFRIPFLGWHLRRSGNIPVDNRNPFQAVRAYQSVADRIQEGLSFVIYPEGARSWGRMAAFKRGSFVLAKKSMAPIVPVTINSAHHRLPRGSAVIRPGKMQLIIHPPLEYEEYKSMDLEELATRVRQTILTAYREDD